MITARTAPVSRTFCKKYRLGTTNSAEPYGRARACSRNRSLMVSPSWRQCRMLDMAAPFGKRGLLHMQQPPSMVNGQWLMDPLCMGRGF